MTVTAPAVDPLQSHSPTASPFHRSHSTSDLDQLSGVPRRLPPGSTSSTSSRTPPSVRSLSDLDAALNFDFEPDFSNRLSLSADDLRLRSGTNETSTTGQSEEILSASEKRTGRMGKGKSLLSRPQVRTPASSEPASGEGRKMEKTNQRRKGPEIAKNLEAPNFSSHQAHVECRNRSRTPWPPSLDVRGWPRRVLLPPAI